MHLGESDPRDSHEPVQAHWSEFCAAWASSFLVSQLLREAKDASLLADVAFAWRAAYEEVLTIDEADAAGIEVDTRHLFEGEIESLSIADFEALYGLAFAGAADDRDVYYLLRSHVAISLQSAVEQYFKAASRSSSVRHLPAELRRWLDKHAQSVPADRWVQFERLDAFRHCLAHNSGRVDEKFLKKLPNCGLHPDQMLPLPHAQLVSFARTAWWMGCHIHHAHTLAAV